MQGAVDKAAELAKTYPNSFIPMQFANPDNPKSHKKTAAEIEAAVEGLDVVIAAGIGTGGTAFGLKEYLKMQLYLGLNRQKARCLQKVMQDRTLFRE